MAARGLRIRIVALIAGIVGVGLGIRPLALGPDQPAPAQKTAAAATAPAAPNPVVMLTNQEDRQRMMDQLKITSFRLRPVRTSRPPMTRRPPIRIRIFPIRCE